MVNYIDLYLPTMTLCLFSTVELPNLLSNKVCTFTMCLKAEQVTAC